MCYSVTLSTPIEDGYMKTAVIMKRALFDGEISQHSKTMMFSATDLVVAGNQWRATNGIKVFGLPAFFKSKKTVEFMTELEKQFGVIKMVTRGKTPHTWVHPLLFIDIALAISPKLKIEVYQWLYDELIEKRNNSGDSYKRMAGCLYARTSNKRFFAMEMADIANQIKSECGVDDWQSATQEQLKMRDRFHEGIAILADVMTNNDEAVRLGILHVKKIRN
jgi:hypothetical protein